jgi:glycerophosphoryl diester phosphodiesterase
MKKINIKLRSETWKVFIVLMFFTNSCVKETIGQEQTSHSLNIRSNKELHDYFIYKSDSSILMSAHRGGRTKGFPENSLEGFNNVLKKIPSFFEIDPRLTKDSVIVLMHDPTLDRTTTGKGKVSDYTWAELKSIRLKDNDGNVTSYCIPTLEEVIKWSKGKTVINLDQKDVPWGMIAALIKKYQAEDHVMLTVFNSNHAKYYYYRFPNIMLSAYIRTMNEYKDFANSGIPWKNMIAYVGASIGSNNKNIVDLLHAEGVRCMVAFAPTIDNLNTFEERQKAYKVEISKQPDIIESDLPTEVWTALQSK